MANYIGIDLHKKTSHVVVLDGERDVVVLDKNIQSKKARFEEVLAPFSPAKVLVEASTQSRWVAAFLRRHGFEVVVGDPNNALMYASRQANCKNDRADARALAFACRAQHYSAVHEVSDEHRAGQELLGTRSLLIETRTMFVNRVRALFAGRGAGLTSCDAGDFRRHAKAALVSEPDLEAAVRPLLEMLAMLEDQLGACDRETERRVAHDEDARRLTSAPGIGDVTALAFVSVVDTPDRFGSAHKLESYLGLVPRISTSAKPGKGGAISKQGATYLRSLLVQSAWSLLRSRDPKARPLQAWAESLSARRCPQLAVTALARRLAGVLWAMWRDKKPFELREPKAPARSPTAPRPLVRRYPLKTAATA